MNLRSTVLLLVIALVAGCAQIDRQPGFAEVQSAMEQRAEVEVHWNQETEEDDAVDQRVLALLHEPLSAEAAVQIALLRNPRLQATYENLGIAQADLVEAGLLRNPVFDAELKFPISGSGTGVEMGVAQQFLDILLLPLQKAMAASDFEIAKTQVMMEILDLAGETRRAFIEYQAAEQALDMQMTALEATGASYELAKRLREAGNMTALDLSNERFFHERIKLDAAEVQTLTIQLRERLNALVGLWGQQTTWTIASRRLPPAEIASPDEPAMQVESLAIERSLDLQAARLSIERSARELGLRRPFAGIDEVQVGASAERETGGSGDWSVGPSVSIPIPIFNQGQPAIARASARLHQSQRRYEALAIEIRAAARAVEQRVIAAQQKVSFFEQVLLPLQHEVIVQAQLQYHAMQLGPLVLLQAKGDQLETGREYIAALRDYWIARSELDQILAGRIVPIPPRSELAEAGESDPNILREEFDR